jgi:ribosomal protein S18 acetylase RimI-like enzyme
MGSDQCALRVRPLEADDAPAVARLLQELGYPADEPSVRKRIQAWSREARGAAFAAIVGERVVGCVAVFVSPFFERPGERARLVALVTDSAYRHRGVGRALLQRAGQFARRSGAVEIEVTSRRSRTEADGFYTALGFTEVSERSRRYIAEI